MQEKTTAQQQKTSTLEANEQMTSKKPPVFQLSADGGDGGGKNGGGGWGSSNDPNKGKNVDSPIEVTRPIEGNDRFDSFTVTAKAQGDPFKTMQLAVPGQVAWVHSPCFSQELQAEAFKIAAGGSYNSGSAKIADTILKLSQTPFRNAEGKENDWAKRMMGSSVLMNPSNKAASIFGSGYPKLVILTFWNDPSNPETGGVNYSYFIDISYNLFPEEAKKDQGGGYIFCGGLDSKKPDLGHYSEKVVEINEWMAKALEFMKACQAGAVPDKINMPSNVPAQLKYLLEQFKKGYESVDKAKGVGTEYDRQKSDKSAEKNYEKETFVEIDGEKYERTKEYRISFKINGVDGGGQKTPQWFLDEYGDKPYTNIRIEAIE
jgi:hypothetical protein